ncbi:hypothetical protein LSAT2_008102 [Lamellibrachia satsuma]|nr:hypothetical protein LSAT2_008102 [Lamellibrachia satsuma]
MLSLAWMLGAATFTTSVRAFMDQIAHVLRVSFLQRHLELERIARYCGTVFFFFGIGNGRAVDDLSLGMTFGRPADPTNRLTSATTAVGVVVVTEAVLGSTLAFPCGHNATIRQFPKL